MTKQGTKCMKSLLFARSKKVPIYIVGSNLEIQNNANLLSSRNACIYMYIIIIICSTQVSVYLLLFTFTFAPITLLFSSTMHSYLYLCKSKNIHVLVMHHHNKIICSGRSRGLLKNPTPNNNQPLTKKYPAISTNN